MRPESPTRNLWQSNIALESRRAEATHDDSVGPESSTGELCHSENALENRSEHIIKIQYIYI
jgi:hypothetical protein